MGYKEDRLISTRERSTRRKAAAEKERLKSDEGLEIFDQVMQIVAPVADAVATGYGAPPGVVSSALKTGTKGIKAGVYSSKGKKERAEQAGWQTLGEGVQLGSSTLKGYQQTQAAQDKTRETAAKASLIEPDALGYGLGRAAEETEVEASKAVGEQPSASYQPTSATGGLLAAAEGRGAVDASQVLGVAGQLTPAGGLPTEGIGLAKAGVDIEKAAGDKEYEDLLASLIGVVPGESAADEAVRTAKLTREFAEGKRKPEELMNYQDLYRQIMMGKV